jgi:hypothetical protein
VAYGFVVHEAARFDEYQLDGWRGVGAQVGFG